MNSLLRKEFGRCQIYSSGHELPKILIFVENLKFVHWQEILLVSLKCEVHHVHVRKILAKHPSLNK